jgi:hypothetical protein
MIQLTMILKKIYIGNAKHPNGMPRTQKATNATSSPPQRPSRKGQRANVRKTRQKMDANAVVQTIIERKLKMKDVRFTNGAPLTEMKQVPFWLIKEVSHLSKTSCGSLVAQLSLSIWEIVSSSLKTSK